MGHAVWRSAAGTAARSDEAESEGGKVNEEQVEQRFERIERNLEKITEAQLKFAEAHLKLVESLENLDGLIRAITREHSNGKAGK